jgi:AcrR family transcriptional regulator
MDAHLCAVNKMARQYTLKRRAVQQAETRQRIVEAAVDLHCTVGPALTSLSMIAERAGVQRHTLYAHFPDERSLFVACSGLAMERDPMPDADPWRLISSQRERLRAGLQAIYQWYDRNEGQAACVLRDAEHHELTREIAETRLGPYFANYRDVLGKGLGAKQRELLNLALSFHTWRTLVRDGGLDTDDAAKTMIQAMDCVK